jgi:hypothetical protein
MPPATPSRPRPPGSNESWIAPTIELEVLARDVAGLNAAEERAGGAKFLRPTQPPRRNKDRLWRRHSYTTPCRDTPVACRSIIERMSEQPLSPREAGERATGAFGGTEDFIIVAGSKAAGQLHTTNMPEGRWLGALYSVKK